MLLMFSCCMHGKFFYLSKLFQTKCTIWISILYLNMYKHIYIHIYKHTIFMVHLHVLASIVYISCLWLVFLFFFVIVVALFGHTSICILQKFAHLIAIYMQQQKRSHISQAHIFTTHIHIHTYNLIYKMYIHMYVRMYVRQCMSASCAPVIKICIFNFYVHVLHIFGRFKWHAKITTLAVGSGVRSKSQICAHINSVFLSQK